jgi:hypothetical protein
MDTTTPEADGLRRRADHGGWAMSETQALLGKIAALRQRLEQAQRLATAAGTAAAALFGERAGTPRLRLLERRAAAGDEHDAGLDRAVGVVAGPRPDEVRGLPRQLTMRARRALERGRELLSRLRPLADAFTGGDDDDAETLFDRHEPLAGFYRETTAMTDTSLRLVPMFPEAASAQLHLCEGLEAILGEVAGRVGRLTAGVETRRSESERIAKLGEWLKTLTAGGDVDAAGFHSLAEELVADARDGGPLRFLDGDPSRPAHFVACHALTTARVAARVARHDPDWRARPTEPVLAALVHDAGMVSVPVELLVQATALDDDGRRRVEAHCRDGAEAAARLAPGAPWLARAAAEHHERLDGTGYPDGLRTHQLHPLSRFLAVCDVYAAMCCNRPYRAARETRTAMADVLLLAEQELLDRDAAERLMHLSFYPVGAAVELADGALGVTAATPSARDDLSSPARPVVILLTDSQGEALPAPRPLDLAECDDRSVIRSLPVAERLQLLGARFPEWA